MPACAISECRKGMGRQHEGGAHKQSRATERTLNTLQRAHAKLHIGGRPEEVLPSSLGSMSALPDRHIPKSAFPHLQECQNSVSGEPAGVPRHTLLPSLAATAIPFLFRQFTFNKSTSSSYPHKIFSSSNSHTTRIHPTPPPPPTLPKKPPQNHPKHPLNSLLFPPTAHQ